MGVDDVEGADAVLDAEALRSLGGRMAGVGEHQRPGDQRHPEDAGKKARPVHQESKRKQPKAPKYSGDIKSIPMHIEEQHSQSIPLRLFKYR